MWPLVLKMLSDLNNDARINQYITDTFTNIETYKKQIKT